jgi:CubicO group peptidase (beta-lactamase class C family)
MPFPHLFFTALLCLQINLQGFNPLNIEEILQKQTESYLRPSVTIDNQPYERMSLQQRMAFLKVPGVSIAVIHNGKLAWAKGYGNICDDPESPEVDIHTLFQVSAISSSLTAVGALLLVQQGKLSLDEDVNHYLTSWKVPENAYTKKQKVTLRRLLSHTAGTSVPGFPGYKNGERLPSTLEILRGKKPLVLTDSVTLISKPGSQCIYSSGGITIVQLLIEDVTKQPYAQWMKQNVLDPLGMHDSTFEQPLPAAYAARAARAHTQQGPVPDNWHNYPAMAATGLWSTPTDIAKFMLAMQQIITKRQDGIVSYHLAHEMLRPHVGQRMGLGVFLSDADQRICFTHTGHNEGFLSLYSAYPYQEKGVVIMLNSDSSGAIQLIPEILRSIADVYLIPGFGLEHKSTVALDLKKMQSCTGSYQSERTGAVNTVQLCDNELYISSNGWTMKLYHTGELNFFMREFPVTLKFLPNEHAFILVNEFGKQERYVRRVM